jgi:hypothetical protein
MGTGAIIPHFLKKFRVPVRPCRRPIGITLGTTLLIGIILSALGFAIASTGVTHLSLMTRRNSSQQALNLSRSVAHRCIAELFNDQEYGESGAADATLIISPTGMPRGSEGTLTFNADRAAAIGMGYSTNNLDNTETVVGYDGTIVPPQAVHLVARGRVGEVVKDTEVVIHIPQFPYAVACSGPIHAIGGLTIGQINNPEDLDDLSPADLLSNATGDESVSISGTSRITGDIQASGSIALDQSRGVITVEGTVRPNESPVNLPEPSTARFDPELTGLIYDEIGRIDYNSPSPFTGVSRRQGDLRITGGAKMDGGILFVDGELSVYGGVEGTGIIIATEDIEIRGGADLASHQVAILTDESITLLGSGRDRSFIQGLLWAGGGFVAEEITVIGAVIAGANGDTGAQFENASMIYDPALAKISVNVQTTTGSNGDWDYRQGFRIDANGQIERLDTRRTEEEPDFTIFYKADETREGPRLDSNKGSEGDPDAVSTELEFGAEATLITSDGRSWTETIPTTDKVEERKHAFARLYANFHGINPDDILSLPPGDPVWEEVNRLDPLAKVGRDRLTVDRGGGSVGSSSESGSDTDGTTITETQIIVIDPSQFLDPKDLLRIKLWKEI